MYSSNESNFQKSQQPQGMAPAHMPGPWSTGLCDCFSDVPNCCLTFWCPCITFGQIAEIVDKGSTSCGASGALYALINIITGCACIYSCFYRSKLRKQYNLPEDPCGDCLVHFCCEACALCQEHRELKRRGFDMSLGIVIVPTVDLGCIGKDLISLSMTVYLQLGIHHDQESNPMS